jgi:hypothetical protein
MISSRQQRLSTTYNDPIPQTEDRVNKDHQRRVSLKENDKENQHLPDEALLIPLAQRKRRFEEDESTPRQEVRCCWGDLTAGTAVVLSPGCDDVGSR